MRDFPQLEPQENTKQRAERAAREDARELAYLTTSQPDEMLEYEAWYRRAFRSELRAARRELAAHRDLAAPERVSPEEKPEPKLRSAGSFFPRIADLLSRFRAWARRRAGGVGAIERPSLARVSLRAAAILVAPLALAGGLHMLTPQTTEAAVAAVVQAVAPVADSDVAALQARLACARRVKVVDGAGVLAGFAPARTDCVGQNTPARPGAAVDPGFRYSRLDPDQARRFADFIQIVEGAHRVGSGTVLGLNLRGLARAALSVFENLFRKAPYVGGSTAMQSGYEVAMSAPRRITVGQKIEYMVDVARLSAGPFASDEARDQFVVDTMTAAIGATGSAFGAPVAGGLLAPVVFGKPDFEDLTDAELCLLAAAAKRPLKIPGPHTSRLGWRKAQERLELVKRRALERCVAPMLASNRINADQAAEMRLEINAIALPRGQAKTANPELLNNTLPGLHTLIADARKLEPELFGVEALRLSATIAGQQRLGASIADLLDRLDRELGEAHCIGACAEGQTPLDIVTVAIRSRPGDDYRSGEIVAAYQNNRGLWVGPIDKVHDGGYRRGDPTRPIASTIKALAVPKFVQAAIETVCRRAWAGLQDSSGHKGHDCTRAEHFMNLAELVARSSNLAFAEAIRRFGTHEIAAWYSSLGGVVSPQETEPELRAGLATGTVAIFSLERLARAVSAIAQGADGETPAAGDATLFQGQSAEVLTLEPDLFDQSARQPLRAALRAAVNRSDGTLRKLREPLAQLRCETSLSKTGTSETDDEAGNGVRDRLIALAVRCGEDRFTIVTMIGSPDIRLPIKGVEAEHAAELALLTLEAALLSADRVDAATARSPAATREPRE